MAAAAIPAIQVGGAIGASLLGKRAAKQQFTRSPEENKYIGQAGGAATSLLGQGQQLMGAGLPGVQASQNYFQTLLSGNRAAQQQAVGSSVANVSDVYRGAARGVGRSGLVGSARDEALAELSRGRAGQIAGLTSGVQPMAAQQLASTGLGAIQAGTGPSLAASSIFGQLLNDARSQRENANAAQAQAGQSAGQLIFGALQNGASKMGRGGGNPYGQLPGAMPLPRLPV